ncbi:MAG: GNAT family N-acetyltransferase [Geminocystis sp.]|nr:GNAT family N-acetyltransferase [Geminocystis sp.]MCS7147145.1 GNAT family N-acetyltransferase [Geminocystis sp.]
MIRYATSEDCKEIANLHKNHITEGFLSALGVRFLSTLYSTIVTAESAFCIVCEENNHIVGFVSGCVDLKKLYKEFIRRNLLSATTILLPKIIKPKNIKRIFETLLYPSRESHKYAAAEILSIAVREDYQGKGVSHVLFEKLKEEFRNRGVNKFKVVVGSQIVRAQKFYEKMGGKLINEIYIHEGEKSYVYEWEI